MIKVRLKAALTMSIFLIVILLLSSSSALLIQPATTTILIKPSYGQNDSGSNTSSTNNMLSSNTNSSSGNYLTYDNSILGIKMQYLANWSIREYAYNSSAAYNVVAGFYSPSKTGSQLGNVSGVSGNFIPYLDILVFASNGMSLNDMVQQRINNFLNNSDFVIDNNQSKPFTIKNGNHPAYMLVYTVTVGGDEFFRKMQVWTIFNDKVYVITFTSQQALFNNYIPIVDKMINSFEVQQTKTK